MNERKCPRCGSPDPARHPAVQYEGEVQVCQHPYHSTAAIPARLEGNQTANQPFAGMAAYSHLSGSAREGRTGDEHENGEVLRMPPAENMRHYVGKDAARREGQRAAACLW